MAKPKNYKTVITLVVLHQDEIPSSYDLSQIVEEANTGEYSSMWSMDTQEVSETEMCRLLESQGSDIEFFGFAPLLTEDDLTEEHVQ